jgi:hypothetical protein
MKQVGESNLISWHDGNPDFEIEMSKEPGCRRMTVFSCLRDGLIDIVKG